MSAGDSLKNIFALFSRRAVKLKWYVDYSDNTKALLQKREILYGRQAKRKDLEPEGNYRIYSRDSLNFRWKMDRKEKKILWLCVDDV